MTNEATAKSAESELHDENYWQREIIKIAAWLDDNLKRSFGGLNIVTALEKAFALGAQSERERGVKGFVTTSSVYMNGCAYHFQTTDPIGQNNKHPAILLFTEKNERSR